MSVRWQGKETAYLRGVRAKVERGLGTAGKNTAAAIRVDLSVPGPSPSPPGEPPHRQTGELVGGVDVGPVTEARTDLVVRVGVLDQEQWPKAVRLARGFVGRDKLGRLYNQKPRPYLGAVERRRDDIVREVAGG